MDLKSKISFVPDWKVMLLGRSHFQRPVDAMAEFIDNSIQACMWEDKCQISCHLFIQASTTPGSHSYVVFLDNGVGMDVNGIAQFATFARAQSDRGQAPIGGSQVGKMFIGKFGVGAKQAGFYLGNRIILFSKPKQEVYRFSMDEKARVGSGETDSGNPFEGFVETIDPTTDPLLPLDSGEQQPMCYSRVQELIRNHLQVCKNGSAIAIRLRKEVLDIFRDDTLVNLSKNLKDIYHFHLTPNAINFTDVSTNRKFQSMTLGKQVKIDVFWNGYNHYGLREQLAQPLGNDLLDFLDSCKIQTRSRFEIHMSVPITGKTKPVDIFGIFWYIPFEEDREQRPPLPTLALASRSMDGNSSTGSSAPVHDQCIIRCYWQNRLVPWSVLSNLPFLSAAERQVTSRMISPRWRKRIVGILFLDWHFDEIANNKLRFSQNLEALISQPDVTYSPVSINDKFVRWLESQCKNDKELHFHDLDTEAATNASGSNDHIFRKLKYAAGKLLSKGDKVVLPLSESLENPQLTSVVITGFVADKELPRDKASYFGAGEILYQRLPENLYGSKGCGRIPTRILYHHSSIKPISNTEIKEFQNFPPNSVIVSLFHTAPSNPEVLHPNSPVALTTGQIFYKFGIQILQFDGKTLTWHLPGLTDERAHRYLIKATFVDDKGKVVRDCDDHRLYCYDEQQKNDVEKKPTNQKMAKQCYYSIYNISPATFGNKCGTYRLDIQVLNPDRQVIYKKLKAAEIKVIPQEVSKVEIINAGGLKMKLGENVPSLKFKFFDKANNAIIFTEPINATLVSNMFEAIAIEDSSSSTSSSSKRQSSSNTISGSVVLKTCSDAASTLEIVSTCWNLVPAATQLLALNNLAILHGKEFSFAVKFSSPSITRFPEVRFPMTIYPGVPSRIVSLTPIEIKLNSDKKSLHLAVTDEWGNRVAPKESAGEQWQVKLPHGPLVFADSKERVMVNSNGEIVCVNNLKALEDFDANGTEAEQGILLKSSTGVDVLDVSDLVIKIIPSNVPTKIQVLRGNHPLEDDLIICSPEEVITNLSYEVLDDVGEVLTIPETALMKLRCSWQQKSRRENLTADGTIPDIVVPRQVGQTYDIDISVIMNGYNVATSIAVEVVAGAPHQWILNSRSNEKRSIKFNAGNISREIKEQIIGAHLQDEYGNTLPSKKSSLTASNIAIEPILEIYVVDEDQMEVEGMRANRMDAIARIPLILNTEIASGGNKRKHGSIQGGESTQAMYILPSALSEEVVHILDNILRPNQSIELRITSSGTASRIRPSESVTCKVGYGLPHKLLISTERYGLNHPVAEGNILIPLIGQLTDIKVHVVDKFENRLDLKNYQIGIVNIYTNEQGFPSHTIRDVKNASNLLLNVIEIPDSILQPLMQQAIANGPMKNSFSLRFAMILFKANNKEQLELSRANLQCSVFLSNSVTALQVELRDTTQNIVWQRSSSNGEVIVPAGSAIPSIRMKLSTEDGQPFVPDSIDYFNVQIWQISNRGEEIRLNAREYYSGQIIPTTDQTSQWIEIEAKAKVVTDVQTSFKLKVAYRELRPGIEKVHPQVTLQIKVSPGPPERLVLKDEYLRRLKKVVCSAGLPLGSSSSNVKLGEIGRDIRVFATDKYGNEVVLTDGHVVLCYIAIPANGVVQGQVPKLVGSDGILLADKPTRFSDADRKFSSIALAGGGVNSTAQDGQYSLCFSLYDSQTKLLAENREFGFEFTSNGTFTSKMQELQDAMAPCLKVISQYNAWKEKLTSLDCQRRTLTQQLKFGDAILAEAQVIQHKAMLENEIKSLENERRLCRPARMRSSRNEERLRALMSDPNVIGRVVELALVKERKYIDVVSMACRRIIDAVVTKDGDTAKKAYDAGIKSLSLSLILPFKNNSRTITVPGELGFSKIEMIHPQNPTKPVEPPGNPKYIVNLLHLTPDREYLRSTIFFNLLKDAIVFDDYWQAVKYREYLVKKGVPCPILFSLDGKQIGKDGVLDPNERDATMNMDFSFGEYFGGSERIQELQEDLTACTQLIHKTREMVTLVEEMKQTKNTFDAATKKLGELKSHEEALQHSVGLR